MFTRVSSRPASKQSVMLNTNEVVAAAIMAFKANGNKIEKYDAPARPASSFGPATGVVVSNKSRVDALLKDAANITQEAKQEAEQVIAYVQNSVLMSVLSGKAVSNFTRDLAKELEADTVPAFRVGLIVYAPNVFFTGQARDAIKEVTAERMYTSQALGKVGDKVAFNFTCLEKRYVQAMDCYSAYGTDDAGNLVSFLTKHENLCATQSLTGKVKSAGTDKWHNNAMVTALNYVKVALS